MINRCPPRLQEKFVKNFTLSAEWQMFPACHRPKSNHHLPKSVKPVTPLCQTLLASARLDWIALDLPITFCADFRTKECRAGFRNVSRAGDAAGHRHVAVGRGLFPPEDG
jgi:hypothetical protein